MVAFLLHTWPCTHDIGLADEKIGAYALIASYDYRGYRHHRLDQGSESQRHTPANPSWPAGVKVSECRV